MVNVVALAAIGVTGFVAVFNAWSVRSRQRDDHQREFRVEIRNVLDEGANAVRAAKRCFERVYNLQQTGVAPASAEAQAAFSNWRAAMQAARFMEDRIAIRLGDGHPAHAAYVTWLETLKPLRAFARGYESGVLSAALADRQSQAHDAFDPARRQFIQAARQVVDPMLAAS